MLRLLCVLVGLCCFTGMAKGQELSLALPGTQLCDCLRAEEYLLIQKWVDVDGELTLVNSATVETLITFLGAYGFVGGHVMNFNWPLDLVVGSADLTALISGFNYNPDFTEALCSWEVVNVASHGWILIQSEAGGYSEAYVHETIFDEFDDGPQVYGQCLLNSFDLEMVYLPDSVVRLRFARKFQSNPPLD